MKQAHTANTRSTGHCSLEQHLFLAAVAPARAVHQFALRSAELLRRLPLPRGPHPGWDALLWLLSLASPLQSLRLDFYLCCRSGKMIVPGPGGIDIRHSPGTKELLMVEGPARHSHWWLPVSSKLLDEELPAKCRAKNCLTVNYRRSASAPARECRNEH